MLRTPARALAIIFALSGTATAHPHEFYEGGADFLFDENGHLAAVRIVWVYDEFTTLYVLSENGLDPTQSPQGDGLDRILATQVGWTAAEWEGDAYLRDDSGKNVALGDPVHPLATVHEGQLVVIFERQLAAPIDMAAGPVELLIYDPSFYAQYTINKRPRIEGRDDCTAEIVNFRMTPEAAVKLSDLMALTIDEMPDDPNVGAEFAERLVLKCD